MSSIKAKCKGIKSEMKITFVNFRCHRDGEFDIPDEGLIRLSGGSGSGKSTLFNGIIYALYGNVRKPYSHGANSCSVTLEMKGITITRTNRPNRLVVILEETEYEDESAQGVINVHFGMNEREFMASSYVVQSLANSLVSMTPADQSKFIETLAFNDSDHLIYRQKFKEKVSECQNTLLKLESKLSTLEERKEKLVENIPNEPNLDGVNMKEIKKEKASLQEMIKKHQQYIPKLEAELKNLKKKDAKNAKLLDEIKKLKIELSHYEELRSNLDPICSEDEIECLEKEREKLLDMEMDIKAHMNFTLTEDEIYVLTEKYIKKKKEREADLPSKEEMKEMKKCIKSLDEDSKAYEVYQTLYREKKRASKIINSIIEDIHYRYGKKVQGIKKYDSFLKFVSDMYQKLKEQKDELDETLRTEDIAFIYEETYTCPECSTNVHLEKNGLVKGEATQNECDYYQINMDVLKHEAYLEELSEWKSALETNISIFKKPLPKQKGISTEDALDLQRRFTLYSRIQEETRELENEYQKKLTSLNKKMKMYDRGGKPPKTDAEIKSEIHDINNKIEQVWRNRSEYSSLGREIDHRKKNIKLLESNLSSKRNLLPKGGRTIKYVENEIEKCRHESLRISNRVMELDEFTELINRYEAYQKELGHIDALEKEIGEVKKAINVCQQELQGAIGLKQAGIEAEILAMEYTIESINEHARGYLEEMFDDMITVRLESHKLTAKNIKKAQINTTVEYKGITYSHISELSGGERQRCELAFLLAVNDMLGSSIILLDECLNNLDAEVNLEVLTHLRELGGEKLILVASHEAIDGVFDNTVQL